MQTIDDVIATLQRIADRCEKQPSRQAYFAILYLQMTQAVKQGIANNAFEDGDRMEKLDVLFAQRYIDAWKNFNTHQPCSQCWRTAFFSNADNRFTVIQHLLTGINAHINLDLAMAAAQTAPGEKIFDLQQDFEKINDVIANLSQAMQTRLENIWWPMRMITSITNGKEQAVLDFSITKARQASWANAVALAMGNVAQQQSHLPLMDKATDAVAQKILNPGRWMQSVLRSVRWTEPASIQEVIAKLK